MSAPHRRIDSATDNYQSSGKKSQSNSNFNPWTQRPYSTRYYTILEKRTKLPVYEHKKDFSEKFKDNRIVILVGETGSGKTTQIPQFLVEMGYTRDGKMVGCT